MQETSLRRSLIATCSVAVLAIGCGAGETEPVAQEPPASGSADRPMPTEPPDAPWPAPPPAAPEPVPTALRCSGNEPFWTLAIDGAHASWTYPGQEAVEELELSGELGTLDYAGLAVWRGELGGGVLVAFVERRECIDSMSGRASAYTAVLSMPDGGLRAGCCTSAAPG